MIMLLTIKVFNFFQQLVNPVQELQECYVEALFFNFHGINCLEVFFSSFVVRHR